MELTAQQLKKIRQLYGLSARETQLVQLLFAGIERSDDIAKETGLSAWTVKVYLRHVYMKLGCNSKLSVVLKINDDLSKQKK